MLLKIMSCNTSTPVDVFSSGRPKIIELCTSSELPQLPMITETPQPPSWPCPTRFVHHVQVVTLYKWGPIFACCTCYRTSLDRTSLLRVHKNGTLAHRQLSLATMCYTEKAEEAHRHPGTKTTINPAQDNCKKQCGPNKTKRHHDKPT